MAKSTSAFMTSPTVSLPHRPGVELYVRLHLENTRVRTKKWGTR